MFTSTKIILGLLGVTLGYGAYRTYKSRQRAKNIGKGKLRLVGGSGTYEIQGDVWEIKSSPGMAGGVPRPENKVLRIYFPIAKESLEDLIITIDSVYESEYSHLRK